MRPVKQESPAFMRGECQEWRGEMSDPLDLFGEDRKPESGGSGFFPSLLLIAALVFVGWQAFQRFGGEFDRDGDREDRREQRDAVAGKTLVFIHERNPQAIEHDLLLREVPNWTADKGLQFRAFDQDVPDSPVPQLIEWAKVRGVSPPMVVLTDRNDKPARAISWPEGVSGLGELLK